MNGWRATSQPQEPGLYRAINDERGDLGPCGDTEGSRGICTRYPGHPGRHMAQGHIRIVAAWPGDHEPTVADLTAVPS